MPEDADAVDATAASAVSPDYCLHCFCEKDESGNPRCCKCGAVVLEEEDEDG